jgi:hypothetical protein
MHGMTSGIIKTVRRTELLTLKECNDNYLSIMIKIIKLKRYNMVKNRTINHKLEQLEPRLLLSADGMVAVLAARLAISFGFDSAIEQDLNCIELTGENDRLYSLEQIEASSDISQFNDKGVRVERYQIESGFNSEDVVTSYYAYTVQTHTDRLVETLHAANGPPGRNGVTGEFVYHASPGINECTLRLNPADAANACQLFNKNIL